MVKRVVLIPLRSLEPSIFTSSLIDPFRCLFGEQTISLMDTVCTHWVIQETLKMVVFVTVESDFGSHSSFKIFSNLVF